MYLDEQQPLSSVLYDSATASNGTNTPETSATVTLTSEGYVTDIPEVLHEFY